MNSNRLIKLEGKLVYNTRLWHIYVEYYDFFCLDLHQFMETLSTLFMFLS